MQEVLVKEGMIIQITSELKMSYFETSEKFRKFLKSDSFCHAGLDPASHSL